MVGGVTHGQLPEAFRHSRSIQPVAHSANYKKATTNLGKSKSCQGTPGNGLIVHKYTNAVKSANPEILAPVYFAAVLAPRAQLAQSARKLPALPDFAESFALS